MGSSRGVAAALAHAVGEVAHSTLRKRGGRRGARGRCDVCGNNQGRLMEIRVQDKSGTFDSFECAISMMAPICEHCQCRVIGHGLIVRGKVFCCAHCAGSP
jgi:hypothetical protein